MGKWFSAAVLFLAACGQVGGSAAAPASSGGSDDKADTASAAAKAQKAVKQLTCSSGSDFQVFHAKLDGTAFDPGSGYFDVEDATINDNYAAATLICTGHTLEEIDCVGFWFYSGTDVVEVTTAKTAQGLTAAYHPLKGDLVKMHTPPWACTVK